MATAYPPQSAKIPSLSSDSVRLFIEKTQDLTLVIDQDTIVIDALQNNAFPAADVSRWIGCPLKSIVGPESLAKLDLLLANDASDSSSDVRWRHINLTSADGSSIPVLAKYLILKSEAQEARVLVLRDLRTQQAANDRFLAVQRETEFQYAERLRELQGTAKNLTSQMAADTSIEQVLAKVENGSFDKAIAETASALEKRSLMAILQKSGGRHDIAAKAARMSMEQWMNLLKKHRLD